MEPQGYKRCRTCDLLLPRDRHTCPGCRTACDEPPNGSIRPKIAAEEPRRAEAPAGWTTAAIAIAVFNLLALLGSAMLAAGAWQMHAIDAGGDTAMLGGIGNAFRVIGLIAVAAIAVPSVLILLALAASRRERHGAALLLGVTGGTLWFGIGGLGCLAGAGTGSVALLGVSLLAVGQGVLSMVILIGRVRPARSD